MMFMSLLTKEMRLRMRRERTIWLIVSYILLLGLISWLFVSATSNSYSNGNWASIGTNLYTFILVIQLLLIIFITPAFTATSINGEKERQTFDLLLCSRLSASALISGKLLAGLLNSLLLIVASIPIFSLVFFFGGISPLQALQGLLVCLLTALLSASIGMCCSTLVSRPAVSTAVSYMFLLLWLGLPLLIAILYPSTTTSTVTIGTGTTTTSTPGMPFYLILHPVIAILSTFNSSIPLNNQYSVATLHLAAWQAYCIFSCIASLIFIAISIWLVKPHTWNRLKRRIQKQRTQAHSSETKASATA